MSAITYPTPSTYLANAPASVIHNSRQPGWADAHRFYFESRGLTVPSVLDVNAERLRRKGNAASLTALARTHRQPTAALPRFASEQPEPVNVVALLGFTLAGDALGENEFDRRFRRGRRNAAA